VAEGIDDLPVPFAPEGVLQRLVDLGTSGDGPLPDGVGVVGGDVQRAVGAADRQRGQDVQLGELVGDHYDGVAESQLDLHEPAVR
jgi:hypothetical protein